LLRFRYEHADGMMVLRAEQETGRSVYVHASARCLSLARKLGFARSLKTKIALEPKGFARALCEALEARMCQVLEAAKRSGSMTVGAGGDAAVVVLARGSSGLLKEDLEVRVCAGFVVVCGESETLTRRFGTDAFGVRSGRFAEQLLRVRAELAGASAFAEEIGYAKPLAWSEVR
jgi:predicted RNA-binding protein YlxR (DUF448 family)